MESLLTIFLFHVLDIEFRSSERLNISVYFESKLNDGCKNYLYGHAEWQAPNPQQFWVTLSVTAFSTFFGSSSFVWLSISYFRQEAGKLANQSTLLQGRWMSIIFYAGISETASARKIHLTLHDYETCRQSPSTLTQADWWITTAFPRIWVIILLTGCQTLPSSFLEELFFHILFFIFFLASHLARRTA